MSLIFKETLGRGPLTSRVEGDWHFNPWSSGDLQNKIKIARAHYSKVALHPMEALHPPERPLLALLKP